MTRNGCTFDEAHAIMRRADERLREHDLRRTVEEFAFQDGLAGRPAASSTHEYLKSYESGRSIRQRIGPDEARSVLNERVPFMEQMAVWHERMYTW